MAKSKQSFNKKEREKKRLQKRKEKEERKAERKANSAKNGADDMLAYLDENGNIVDTPMDPSIKREEIDPDSIILSIPKKEHVVEEKIREGKVSFFNDSKGFGFIIDANNQKEYFFHVSGLTEPITENDKVQFELERGKKGMNAANIKRL